MITEKGATDMTTDTLIVVRASAEAVINAELVAIGSRAVLDRAVREAVVKLGEPIDAVSEASGLPPAEIYRILARMPDLDDATALAGAA